MSIGDFLENTLEAILEKLLEGVRRRRDAVCALHIIIPKTVAGYSTDKVRLPLEEHCTALGKLADILELWLNYLKTPCHGLSGDEEIACLRNEIAEYGISLAPSFDSADANDLRIMLRALETFGARIAECINHLEGYDETPQSAFQKVLFPKLEGIKNAPNPFLELSYDGDAIEGLTQKRDLNQYDPNIDSSENMIVGFWITLPFGLPDEDIERVTRHELAHALLNLLLETDYYGELIPYLSESGVIQVPRIFVEYLGAIKDETWEISGSWQYTINYNPGEFDRVSIDEEIIEAVMGYYPNARRAGSNPTEDFSDAVALFIEVMLPGFPFEEAYKNAPDSTKLKEAIQASPRFQLVDRDFCCWVYTLLGLDLDEMGCIHLPPSLLPPVPIP